MAQERDLPPGADAADKPPREASPWLHLPYLVLFIVVFEVCKAITYLTAVVQLVLRIATGRPNERLRQLGGGLSRYLREIAAYLTQHSDATPYPFGPWPQD